jgi:hypothetical protein
LNLNRRDHLDPEGKSAVMMTRRLFGSSVCALAAVAFGAPKSSLALGRPTGTPLLAVSGRIGVTNDPAGAVFDRAMLDALPQGRFLTTNSWDPERRAYSGPWLKDLVAAVGATGHRIKVTALNDYAVTMPVPADQPFPPILASRIDDQPIPTWGKGPLWVMYDLASDPGVRTKEIEAWAVWNVKSIEVLD